VAGGSSDGNPQFPTTSDPELAGTTPGWSDRFLPERPFRFVADGRVTQVSWADLAQRVVDAFPELHFAFAESRPPPFDKKAMSYLGATPGYGWLVGEAELQAAQSSFLGDKRFRSLVLTFQAWANPAVDKHELGVATTARDWQIRARAGRVLSQVTTGRGPRVRQFKAVLDTEDTLGWLPQNLLARAARTSGTLP
jgi:hypothetical protein